MSLTIAEESYIKNQKQKYDLEKQIQNLTKTQKEAIEVIEAQRIVIQDQYDIDVKVIQDQLDTL